MGALPPLSAACGCNAEGQKGGWPPSILLSGYNPDCITYNSVECIYSGTDKFFLYIMESTIIELVDSISRDGTDTPYIL